MNPWESEHVIRHSEILAKNFRRWTGRNLIPGGIPPLEFAKNLFEAPFVVVSHGTQIDPILNYGNAEAARLWEMTWDELTATPSRQTAEVPERAERARLLEHVTRDGFIEDYSGVRISKTGRRFRIYSAVVWNLFDDLNGYYGQAATFRDWSFL